MSDVPSILKRVTLVCGTPVEMFSAGFGWFSNRNEAKRARKEHEKVLAFMKKSLARSGTFAVRESKPRGPNKLQRAAAELRKQVCELISSGFSYEQAAEKLWPEEFVKASPEGRAKLLLAKRVYGHYRQAIRRGEFVEEDHNENSLPATAGSVDGQPDAGI